MNDTKHTFAKDNSGVFVFDSVEVKTDINCFETTFQENTLISFYIFSKHNMKKCVVLTKGNIATNFSNESMGEPIVKELI